MSAQTELRSGPNTPRWPERTSWVSGPRGRQRGLVAASYWSSTLVDGACRILVPLYLAELGASLTSIGAAFVLHEAFGLLACLYGGMFVNRYGYKQAILLSLFLHTIGSLGYLFIYAERGLWCTLLLVSVLRSCRGVAKELRKNVSSAYFKALPKIGSALGRSPIQALLGGKDGFKGLGLLLGGCLLAVADFRSSFILLGLFTFLCLAWASIGLKDYRERLQVTYLHFFEVSREMTLLAGARALLYFSRDVWLVLPFPLYLKSQGVSELQLAGLLGAGFIVFGLFQPIAARRLQPHLRDETLAGGAPILLALIPLSLSVASDSFAALLAGVLAYNLAAAVATVPHNQLHLKFARPSRASADIANYRLIAQLGKLVAPPFSAFLFGIGGMKGCLVASSVALLLSALLALLLDWTPNAVATPAPRDPSRLSPRHT